MANIVLSKPLEYKGTKMTEINLQLEDLRGSDLIQVETQMNAEGKFALMSDYSKAYQIRVAAKAAKLPCEVLEGLSAQDFNKIASAVQFFLMGSVSSDLSGAITEKTESLPEKS